jgi:hypothetical protein
MSVQYEFTPLSWGHTQTCVEGGGGARHVEGGGGAGTHISTESSESEEEEPTPTSPSSHPSRRKEERCGDGWSFPPPAYAREEEWCDDSWSFLPCGAREKQTFHSGLGPASLRAPSAC